MSESTHVRLALAAVSGCTAAAFLYAFVRVVQYVLLSEPDPALIIWSQHAGYFWRIWIAFYGGGTFAFLAWITSGRDAAWTARVLARGVVVAAVLATAQGVLVP